VTRFALRYFRMTVVLLVVAALVPAFPVVRAAEGTVNLSGRIFQPDGTTPFQGAIVRVVKQDSGEAFNSTPTDATGHYEFRDLPAGTYNVEVEVPDGIYQLNRSVRIGQNDTASISFTVKPQPAPPPPPPPPAAAAPESGAPAPASPDKDKRRKKGILWASIGGGAALLAIVASGNNGDNQPASPSTP
jgi:carboxypeptidase family protein